MVLLASVVQLILVWCAKVKITQGSRETMLDCFIIGEPNKGFHNCYSTLSFFFARSFLWGEGRDFQNYLRFNYFSDATSDEFVYCRNTRAMDQSVKSLCNFKKHRSPIGNLFFRRQGSIFLCSCTFHAYFPTLNIFIPRSVHMSRLPVFRFPWILSGPSTPGPFLPRHCTTIL